MSATQTSCVISVDNSTDDGIALITSGFNNEASTSNLNVSNTTSATKTHLANVPIPNDDNKEPEAKPFKPTWRFWAILFSLSVMSLCATAEATIIVNALPTIAADLGAGPAFLWVPNAFLLACATVMPLFGQMSDVFGRRYLLLIAVALFVFGSALCGGSSSLGMLIAARAIQGMGSGGIKTVGETIMTDLVPLRQRSQYMSILMIGSTFGAALGPFLGGVIIVSLGWRWIFYLTAILTAASLILLFFLLKLQRPRTGTFKSRLKRIDAGGNAICIGSVVAVLLALTWGGPVFPWDNYKIIVPLTVGLLGLVVFTAFEWTPALAPEPSFPRILVSNRTSTAALLQGFLAPISMYWMLYFFPIYFQGILAKSPSGSGIAVLPISACMVPFAIVSGVVLAKYGKYKILHLVGWAINVLALGLCSVLDRESSTGAWVCFQIIGAAGVGILTAILLPAVQAPLDEKYVATATAMYCFINNLGSIFGVTIPSVIFTNRVRHWTHIVSDPRIAAQLANGQAYELATEAFLNSITDRAVRDQVIEVFTRAIRTTWYIGIAFAGVGFLVVFMEKEIKMRTEVNSEFGLQEERPSSAPMTGASTNEIELRDLPALEGR